MWCSVVRCRRNGERIKREDWPDPVEGELTIASHGFTDGRPPGLEAQLKDPRRFSVPVQVLKPLWDPVLACTHGAGFLLRGREIWSDDPTAADVREVGQVWFVVPKERG